ncbi:hypothetical protein KC19_2G214800 [Ceratodon purpureus]|uniref:PHD-type domain-containing protein n=1 Tax=Ceratodon purpureus TaxID=3225 RepID=A0A8T0J0B9_CERPU|nr:hypothetical protein KC19_2G214800 [Ceratodon purpureus]
MGAQKSSWQEGEGVVVEMSRGERGSAIGTKMGAVGEEADAVVVVVDVVAHGDVDHASSGTTRSSDGKPGVVDAVVSPGEKDVTSRPDEAMDEAMEEATREGPEEGSPKTESTVAHVTNGNAAAPKNIDVVSKSGEAAPGVESPVKDSGDSVVWNGLPQENNRERLMKNGGSRKRKKTIHYINSRVPHSRVPNAVAPALESEEGSDGQDSPEEAEDVPVRPSQAPRAAATKLKSMVPVGDKLLKAPRNAKELMATRLLEGHFVRCSCRGIQLTGMLKDMGVQCDCRNCRGSAVVSISAFEAHSGSTSHHPSDNIYLENGKNLRDILSAGQEAADCGDNILRALKMAIGDIQGVERRKIACAKCGSAEEAGDLIPCKGARCSLVLHAGCIGNPKAQLGDWLCSKCEKTKKHVTKTKRLSSGGVEKDEARVKEKDSARKARDAQLHSALFMPGGLKDGTELGYYTQDTCKLTGVKQNDGIHCSCCRKVITCAEFEQHAGCEGRQNPYGSIMLITDGRSLKDVCKDLIQQKKLGEKEKRMAREGDLNCCYDCEKSGELKCNVCNQGWCADHQGGEKDSDGKWLCRFCQQDTLKVVKNGQRVSGKPMEGIHEKDERGRVIRHLQPPASAGGCAICKKWNVNESGFVQGMTMLVCDQCGREYHVSCLKGSGAKDLNELPEGEWFCRKDCKVIDEILTQLVANGPESLSDSIISELLESRQQQSGAKEKAETSSPSFGWQILCGKGGSTANVMTLAEAVNIFTECTDPITDAKTGKNLIPPMVHSRRSKDYDFEGVFCVVLKLNEKVVSAALLQIFGREIAEVPLVATSHPHQGQGFCKALMTTIERLLGVLSVERLVLPTAKETESIWINKFGFSRMDEEKLAAICTTIRLMTFTGTCMLGKEITPMTV